VDISIAPSGVPIRLSAERWQHIVENHDDLAGYYHDVLETIATPDAIARGHGDERLALRRMGPRDLVVVYREVSASDGFVITAFFTTQARRLLKRGILWQKPS